MSKEYYVIDDKEKKEIQVCRYSFDVLHPNGEEIIVTSRSYGDVFTLHEAKNYAHKMAQKFNSKRFRREKPVWWH